MPSASGTEKSPYWSIRHCAWVLNFCITSSVHHCFRLPSLSYCLPLGYDRIYIFLIVRCCLWNIKLKKQILGANFRLYFKTHIVHVFEIVIHKWMLIAKFDIPSGFVCQCVTPLEVTLRCLKNGLFLIDFVAFNHSSVSKLMMGERVYFFLI